MTAKKKVVLLDQAQIGLILKLGGVAALDAIAGRGDKFLFVRNAYRRENLEQFSEKQQNLFEDWIKRQRYAGKIVDVKGAGKTKERKFFDPLGKAGTKGNNQELWDMGARKFMFENQDLYDFEVISRDKDFLDNKLGTQHPLSKITFERVSVKSAMTWLLVHPDVNLTKEQFMYIRKMVRSGDLGRSSDLELDPPTLPDSYEHSRALKVSNRFNKLVRRGASASVLGFAAVPVFGMVKARAEEKEISFLQAADELRLRFTEEELLGLAAEVGVDLLVSATPVGWVKKGWEVLGNFDDIVAVTQLYGAAYPDNETIQDLAVIAGTIEQSPAFEVYVDGRDQLVGFVSGAMDQVLGIGEEEPAEPAALKPLREAVEAAEQTASEAARAGASAEEANAAVEASLADVSTRVTAESVPQDDPNAPGQAPAQQMPDVATRQTGTGMPLNAAGDGEAALPANGVERKTSFDRFKAFGPDQGAADRAMQDYQQIWRESLLDMAGDHEAAEMLAVERLSRTWGLTNFSENADGIVLKHPVEKVYPPREGEGHDYVRNQVLDLLTQQGIKATRWSLMPNERTEKDWRQGGVDTEGFGPRMTLTYGDETGQHILSEAFQARLDSFRNEESEQFTPPIEPAPDPRGGPGLNE